MIVYRVWHVINIILEYDYIIDLYKYDLQIYHRVIYRDSAWTQQCVVEKEYYIKERKMIRIGPQRVKYVVWIVV